MRLQFINKTGVFINIDISIYFIIIDTCIALANII